MLEYSVVPLAWAVNVTGDPGADVGVTTQEPYTVNAEDAPPAPETLSDSLAPDPVILL